MQDLVEYGRLRGVSVMVEFDVPGHARSWCEGCPDVCPSPTCQGPLNVASNASFDLIDTLLHEATGMAESFALEERLTNLNSLFSRLLSLRSGAHGWRRGLSRSDYGGKELRNVFDAMAGGLFVLAEHT